MSAARACGAVLLILAASPALAHDDAAWIQQGLFARCPGGQIRSAVGQRLPSACESCCGVQDCYAIPRWAYKEAPEGYTPTVGGAGFAPGEVIPYSEAAPFSPDGRLWVCRDHGSWRRRCVFDRPPSS